MAPLHTALSALILFLGTSSCNPVAAASPSPADTFTIHVGNISLSGPDSRCFVPGTVKKLLEGPAQFKQCVQLGDNYNAFILDRAGKDFQHGLVNRCYFLTTGDCEHLLNEEATFPGIDPPGHCGEVQGQFNAILYTDECPTGGGGKV